MRNTERGCREGVNDRSKEWEKRVDGEGEEDELMRKEKKTWDRDY